MGSGWAGGGLFFNADVQLGTGLLDNLLSILLRELLVLVVALNGLFDLGDFVLRQVTALIFSVFPRVKIVVGAVGPLANDGEGAMLHALDLEDLFEKGLRRQRCIHKGNIDDHLYLPTKNGTN